MATTIIAVCPKCKVQVRTPSEYEGKRARCKSCGAIFTIEAAAASAKAPAAKAAAPGGRAAGAKAVPPASAKKTSPAKAPPVAKAPPPPPPRPPEEEGPGVYSFAGEDTGSQAKAPESKPVPASTPKSETGQLNQYQFSTWDITPRCPNCAKELTSAEDIICLNCGYNTRSRMYTPIKRTFANTAEDRLKWLTPGFICAGAAVCSIAVIVFLWLGLSGLRSEERNKDEWWFDFILPLQIWGSILAAFVAWFTGKFAIHRLIYDREPPEQEK